MRVVDKHLIVIIGEKRLEIIVRDHHLVQASAPGSYSPIGKIEHHALAPEQELGGQNASLMPVDVGSFEFLTLYFLVDKSKNLVDL